MKSIGVVIPTYNAEHFIEESIESIQSQTLPPDVICVVDDCSTDRTIERLHELQRSSNAEIRIIELTINSGGPAKPMNVGIEATETEYIAILDQDDLMTAKRLELGLKACESFPFASLALGRFTLFSDRSELSDPHLPTSGSQSELENVPSSYLGARDWRSKFFRNPGLQQSCSNHFFPRRTWARIGGYRESANLASDYDFAIRAFNDGVAWIDETLFRKRVHEGNAWITNRKNRLLMLRLQEELAREFDDPEIAKELNSINLANCYSARLNNDLLLAACYAQSIFMFGNPRRGIIELGKCAAEVVLRSVRNAFGRELAR